MVCWLGIDYGIKERVWVSFSLVCFFEVYFYRSVCIFWWVNFNFGFVRCWKSEIDCIRLVIKSLDCIDFFCIDIEVINMMRENIDYIVIGIYYIIVKKNFDF